MMNQTLVAESFTLKFGSNFRLFFSPGRINLIGEHIDYNHGFVMPAAIDKGIWFAVAPNQTDTIHLVSEDLKEELSFPMSQVAPTKGWADYLLGIVDQLMKNNFPLKGFNCVFGGNLPIGAGLSSSAAVECGLLYSLDAIFNLGLSKKEMALMAQRAEHTFPGVQCGIMDQFANIFGLANKIIYLDCDSLDYKYLPLPSDDYDIILINTKVHHELSAGEYNIRRKQCGEGFAQLHTFMPGIDSFRDLSVADVEKYKKELGTAHYNRCLYVVQEIERTKQAVAYLEIDDIPAFGQLMYQTHQGLSKLYEVSCAELDFLVDKAAQHPIILGSRLMGGGFGGCTINIAYKNQWKEIVNTIISEYVDAFQALPEVYTVNTANGTHELNLNK